MAFHLSSSSHSLIGHDHHHHPLCNSLHRILQFSPTPFLWTPKSFNHPSKLNSLTTKPKFSLSVSPVSLQDSISTKSSYPDEETTSATKNYAWVNPKSSRASELRQQSYDGRYSFLTKIAESLDSSNPTEIDVSRVLSSLRDNPLEQDAVIIINNMRNPETALLTLKFFLQKLKAKREVILYNVTLKVFRKVRNFDGVEMLFDEMLERGVKPDKITFSTIISCARLCSLPDKALEWFEKMTEFGCVPDDAIRSAMIDAYGRLGNVDKALSLYEQAKREKWRIDVVTFSTLIKIYSSLEDFHGAFKVFEEMKSLGMKPNLAVYNIVLDAMGKAKRPWQVKTVSREMARNGIAPTFPTYAALLRAYGKARYAEDALIVYRETKEKGLELSVVLYNTLLAMCADIGYTSEAIEIFEDLKKSGTCQPDSWTYSSMITIYSSNGNVLEAEKMLNEMLEAGFEPNIFVLTSLIQCYGKVNQMDKVLKTFDSVLELGITPDDRFCGCLLNVMNQTPKEELGDLITCIEKANPKLGCVVKLLVEEGNESAFNQEAFDLINTINVDVKKAYCNSLIDLCVNLNRLDKACELLELGLRLEIYPAIQSKSPTQWSLNLKSLSLGAALTALHIWMSDLSKTLDNGEELPPLLGINTGHGKHNSENGLAGVFASHLRELGAPFHEAPDRLGWFSTTKVAAMSWLESRKSYEPVPDD